MRLANIVGRKLHSCLLLSIGALSRTPDRAAMTAMVGAGFDATAREALFAIAVADPRIQPSRSVCACYGVTRDVIERAIVDGRMTRVAEIGAALRAGSNCGSCIPEIEEILQRAKVAF